MLRVSKLADYGTVVMVYLAKHSQRLCNAKDIAKATYLTVPTVSKILKLLSQADLLRSQRGTKGGYQLLRPAADISVLEIIRAMEGRSGLTECTDSEGQCALQAYCHVQGNWHVINQAIEMALDSVSLDALAKPGMGARGIDVSQIEQLSRVAGEHHD